jgi:peptide/nickel transport system permease protein
MAEVENIPIEAAIEKKGRPFLLEVIVRLVKEKPLGTFGGAIVLIFLLVGIFADLAWIGLPDIGLAPYGYNESFLEHRLEAPSGQFLLGTDNLGRDLLSRIIYGARISMYVGLAVPAIGGVLSLLIGGISGLFGGKVDMIIQRFVDTVMCFPPILIMLTVTAIIGPGLIQVILLLGILGGIGGSVRVIRSAVLAIKENVYVDAARAIGASNMRILLRHLLPNIMAIAVVGFSMAMGGAILAEATLSFLGFGIPPPTPSWGGMLSGSARTYMTQAPWMALWVGLALTIVVYGMNVLGDAVRDILDPRLRGGLGRYDSAKIKKLRRAKAAQQTIPKAG